jgi:hypothetical protein
MHADAPSAREFWTNAVVFLCFFVWCGTWMGDRLCLSREHTGFRFEKSGERRGG